MTQTLTTNQHMEVGKEIEFMQHLISKQIKSLGTFEGEHTLEAVAHLTVAYDHLSQATHALATQFVDDFLPEELEEEVLA